MHKRDNDFFFSGNFLGGAILERSYGFIGQNRDVTGVPLGSNQEFLNPEFVSCEFLGNS